MSKIYNLVFFGTYILISKAEKYDGGNKGSYLAWSTVLCLTVTHFLFVFSCLILLFPDTLNFSLGGVFTLIVVLAFIFWFAFLKNNKYKNINVELIEQRDNALRISMGVNLVLISTFFLMSILEIYKAT